MRGSPSPYVSRLAKPLLWVVIALAAVVVVGALDAWMPTAYAGDSIVILQGDGNVKTFAGDVLIVDLELDGIRWELRGSLRSTDWDEVVSWNIDPYARPRDYQRAYDLMQGLSFVEAIHAFEGVVDRCDRDDSGFDELTKHLALYYICECGNRASDRVAGAEKTINAGSELLRDFPKSYYKADVLEYLGIAYLITGQESRAIQSFRELARIAPARGFFRLGLLYFQKQEYTDARSAFEEAGDDEDAPINTLRFCRLYIAKCLIYGAPTNFDRAKRICEELVGEAQDLGVLGGTYLMLGICQAKDGEWRDAFLSFVRTATAYKDDVSRDELKSATGYAVLCAERLSQGGTDAEKWEGRKSILERHYNELFSGEPLPGWPW